jgi:hypothetical protein
MAAKTSINIPKIPKGLRIIFAVFALLIIIGFVAIMMTQIILKASDLVGLQQTPVTTTNCTDTDNGNFQDAFGTCTDSTRQSKSDTCVLTGIREELKLQEWFCVNNTCKSEIKDCNPGFNCAGGMCVKV